MPETTQPAAASTAPTDDVDVRKLLPLPAINGLSQQQVRGMTCVWDGIALTGATAIDLGPRRLRWCGHVIQWFPRGCRPCVLPRAMEKLHLHTQSCEQCVYDFTQCATGRGLVRLIRETRR
ncbi:hypothetical protein [Streptomyces sp. V3I7]|uniref:hypothetical protein n=1 Tax=Streptomyces sp. V3I7 TaxID=3042278 RepID=UPI0027848B83|nr:hypothetical protein [Streptomyces sp. V3I7]MDQ0991626.1 hypothetical protein [Streptomyces sp. V3I7]